MRRTEPFRACRCNSAAKPLAVKVPPGLAEDGQTWALGEVPLTLAPGKPAQAPVRLPRVRAGDYFIDAVARSSRGIEACAAHAVAVSTASGIERVELEKSFIERGESIGGKVVLRGTPPAGSILRLCFRDSYHRVLEQRDLRTEPAKTEYAFQYRAGAPDTILMRAQALLLASNGDEIEMKRPPSPFPSGGEASSPSCRDPLRCDRLLCMAAASGGRAECLPGR